MPSIASQWADAKGAWNDSSSHDSPGTRFGLIGDPLAYIFGNKYRRFINKTGDKLNERLSEGLGVSGGNGWVANKPASTIGLLTAAYYGGGAMMNGGGGGGSGAPTGNDLGIFSNGGQGGMSQVGGGNLGNAVNAGSFTPMQGGASSPMSQMRLPQQQQEQPKNHWLADELERQAKEKELKKQIAEQLGQRYV